MGPLSAVMDPQFRQDLGRGLVNTAGYGIASMLGAPADVAGVVGLQFGNGKNPDYGTEWFRQVLENEGLVGPERNEWAEGIAGLLSPLATPNFSLRAMQAAKAAKLADKERLRYLIENMGKKGK